MLLTKQLFRKKGLKGMRFGKHGMFGTAVYSSWQGMKARCSNPNDSRFKDYGGRGIKVCSRWLESFQNFYKDMGDKPEGKSLDRMDNDKGYNSDNCRWATPKEQTNNMRNNIFLTYRGLTLSLREWSKKSGIKYQTLFYRLRKGWKVERILINKTFVGNLYRSYSKGDLICS